MSNRENVPALPLNYPESPAWTPSFFNFLPDSPNYSSLNVEQAYTVEAQYPHIRSYDLLPLTSLHLSAASPPQHSIDSGRVDATASARDFSISPRSFKDIGTPFGKDFELSDDWVASGSYISPIIHASRTKPTLRLDSSPVMSYSSSPSANVIPPRHARTSVRSSMISPFKFPLPSSSPMPCPPSVHPSPVSKGEQCLVTPHALLPMSPLTPLTPSPTKIVCAPNPRKRRPVRADSESPTVSSKRVRYSTDDGASHTAPKFTQRTFPPAPFMILPLFPLLYRRFPVSSYFKTSPAESPCVLFGMSHPGGVYNAPRDAFDLYTPRFVKGVGAHKVGLCPVCVEKPERGGEGKKVWLSMKFSSFNYHMQYYHGILASTARPLSPPIEFRVVARPLAKKRERASMQQGKCHKCLHWIDIETVKDVDTIKVKELFWWKHAVACHGVSVLEGEEDVFEEDRVYEALKQRT
ncbi:hypothetical protein FB45DRAFT_900059 [Roridomyces roridus]|uniref:Transcription regulator Rua1 C-terminal domain-containing protein n=1 Tax=Roridomyces roridus TaxID=1738132 RepID=A0AAD7C7T6_9AGAR|nr:hypothetical protein FB45DRAFT_900059 [Roridomyces roridus]